VSFLELIKSLFDCSAKRDSLERGALCPLLFNVSLFVESQIKLPLTTLKLMTTTNHPSKPKRRAAWLTLLLIVLISLVMVIVPVLIVQPFKPQSERGLALSYVLRRWSPLVTLAASVLAVMIVVWLWSGTSRWWRKAVLVVIILPLLAATWFARQNHFEWMFNPLANASYTKLNDVTFIDDTDIVMAIENNGEAVAYPIRFMAYHHVVQDVVGGTPIVATY
jgi:hypothetical protein